MQVPLDPAAKKAYEVAYALFRVADLLPSRSFAEFLERKALELLASSVANLATEARTVLRTTGCLIAFGKDVGIIHSENGDLLLQQFESLAALLQERESNAVTPADLSDVFSGSSAAEPLSRPARLPKPSFVPTQAAASPSLNERQNVILDKIRQSGNCRTRDLQTILPSLSERTLRYDLQRLVEEGKIERGGGGGPASWYRLKTGG